MTLGETMAARGAGSSRRLLGSALRLLIAAALVALVLRNAGTASLAARFTSTTAVAAVGGALLLMLSQALAAYRWRLLLGPGAPGWAALFHLYLVGGFFSLFLPTAVGGDAFRATMVARVMPRAETAVVSVLLDRAFGVAALVVYGVAGLVLEPGVTAPLLRALRGVLAPDRLLLILAAGVLLLGAFVLLARRSARLRAIPSAVLDAVREAMRRGPSALAAFGISLLVQGLMVLLWVVVARGVGLTLPAELFLVGVPLVTLATMLPLSLAGLGVREWAWVAFLSPFGIAAPDAVALSLAYFACPLLSGLTGGLLFGLRGAGPGLSVPERPGAGSSEAAADRS